MNSLEKWGRRSGGDKAGKQTAEARTEEREKENREGKDARQMKRSGKGRGRQQQVRTYPNSYKSTIAWPSCNGATHKCVLLGWCLENGAWVVIHAGLEFRSQFPLTQSYLREPPCPRIPPAKSLIFNWLWNQKARALQKHRQRYASNLGYPWNGAPGQTHS